MVITQNEKMRAILSRINTIAASDSSVLLIGETGVGKELFADYIHRSSPRSEKPFVKIALSAMPHDLLESELFGHERGAFTSATGEKRGLFELAHTGSLFLDDIDDVPQSIQTKLLRVLESHEVMRVGGTTTIPIDVRVITASKADLRDLVSRNLFRADLYYRINVFPVEIPALRDRREDIPILVKHFLERFAPGKRLTISPQAQRALINYSWPGNVRELRNITQRVALFAEDEIGLKDLPPEVNNGSPIELLVKACSQCFVDDSLSFTQIVACLETNLLRQALKEAAGNRTQAARALGLSLSTLRDKLKKYGLENGLTTYD
jgi:transcriptional regulator with GAF, ATPase, and Fis domain